MIRQLARLCFALAVGCGPLTAASALAPVAPGNGFYVDVSLTDPAAALLQQHHETIAVGVTYSRDGKAAGAERVDAPAHPSRVLIPATVLGGVMNQDVRVAVTLRILRDGRPASDSLTCSSGLKTLAEVQIDPLALYCASAQAGDPAPRLPVGASGAWTQTQGRWVFTPASRLPSGGGYAVVGGIMPSHPGHHHSHGWSDGPPPPPGAGQGAPPPQPSNAPSAADEGGQGTPIEPAPASLPGFPWPPPLPSEKMNLPHAALVAHLGAHPSLGAAGRRLVGVLTGAGYLEYSYFHAPGGFALVARLEQFEDDGSPGPADRRFLDPQAAAPFSLTGYIKHLFVAPDGYYRLIVFVVSDKSFAPAHTAPSAAAAQAWLEDGANMLPAAFDKLPITGGHQLTALIYEFHKHGSDTIATLDPGRLDARTHLLMSGLYARLTGP